MLISEIDVIQRHLSKCLVCRSDVHHYVCNGDLIKVRPDAADWDWWTACDNVDCVNHYGEGMFQHRPSWDVDIDCDIDALIIRRQAEAAFYAKHPEEPVLTLADLEATGQPSPG